MKEFFARHEVAVHDIIVFLENFGRMSETSFEDADHDGFDCDMGYFMEGLRELQSYFSRKKRGD